MPPHPHDKHLQLAWKICRFGIEALDSSQGGLCREKVLRWMKDGQKKFENQFFSHPQYAIWEKIIVEDESLRQEIRETLDFLSLSEERQGYWRPLIQSQPFTCLLPGRTTRERRSILSHLP